FRALLKTKPGDPRILLRLAQSLEAQGRGEEALGVYEELRSRAPAAVEPALREMALLDRLGRHDRVREVGEAFLRENGEVPRVLNALAVHATSRGEPDAAETYLKRSLAADPSWAETRELLARLRMAQGRVEEAVAALEEALRGEPDRVSSLLLLATIRDGTGEKEKAEALYRKILALAPRHPVAANNLAMILAERDETLPEALRLAEIAAEEAPDNPFTADTLGWVLYRQGAYERARRQFEAARKTLPENPEVAYHLGATLAKLGDRTRARALLEEALAAKEKGPWAFDAGQMLEELKRAGE
ncbi:MAG: tetratricopeptide repeat protein, partial [Candidatus Dadabacteria bacterium]